MFKRLRYSGCASSTTNHGFTPMALRCSAQHPSRGAVTRLSYPEAPDFSRCRPRQVSPCGPRASLHAHQPTCAVRVVLLRYAPRVGLSYRLSLDNRSSGHFLPDAVSVSPNLIFEIGSRDGIAPSSALRSRTSPIRGMQLQRLLNSRLAAWNLRGWRPLMPFRTCVFAVGGLLTEPSRCRAQTH